MSILQSFDRNLWKLVVFSMFIIVFFIIDFCIYSIVTLTRFCNCGNKRSGTWSALMAGGYFCARTAMYKYILPHSILHLTHYPYNFLSHLAFFLRGNNVVVSSGSLSGATIGKMFRSTRAFPWPYALWILHIDICHKVFPHFYYLVFH